VEPLDAFRVVGVSETDASERRASAPLTPEDSLSTVPCVADKRAHQEAGCPNKQRGHTSLAFDREHATGDQRDRGEHRHNHRRQPGTPAVGIEQQLQSSVASSMG